MKKFRKNKIKIKKNFQGGKRKKRETSRHLGKRMERQKELVEEDTNIEICSERRGEYKFHIQVKCGGGQKKKLLRGQNHF